MTTIADALREARARFTASESAGLDAHVLLAAVLGVDRTHLLGHPEQVLSAEQAAQFGAWVERHAAGEPVAYILGRRGFYDLDLLVTSDVLIPRPETELLLEQALAFAQQHPGLTAVDIGTGSGALAVTFAKHAPGATVYAVDISPQALAVAQRNAQAQDVAVTFLEGDLLGPLIERGVKVDLVMANLPYIATDEVPRLDVSRYEPVLALDGGPDGLDLVRRLLAQLPQVARPGALVLLEIGADQGAATLALAGATGRLFQDYAGLDRIVSLIWTGTPDA
jgi:release factor glutamine methyltransferase